MPMQNRNKHRRRYAAPIGGLFVVLAIIGVVTVVVTSIRMTTRFLDNTSEKQMFSELILPVAMFDPPPFEDPSSLEMTNMLRYAMWATIKSDKVSSYQSAGDFNEYVIPATDLDVAAARLFGPDIHLEHQQFDEADGTYVYDAAEGVYRVPKFSQLYVYTPEVEDITKDGDLLRLYVAYIPPEDAWTDVGGPLPDKHMYYLMRRAGDSYQIAKVQDVPREQDAPLEGDVGSHAKAE